uniref:MORF/ORRM1/DAG-like MORF domain-containing protein n=1 Tax=Cucumis melo TaxID=3656 RepID=A0A9I9ECJ9_CUCME
VQRKGFSFLREFYPAGLQTISLFKERITLAIPKPSSLFLLFILNNPMATLFSRSLPKTLILGSTFSRSFLAATGAAVSASSRSSFSLLRRLRPLAAIIAADFGFLSSATSVRYFSTSDDPKPNGPPTFSDDGCDFKHWLVVMDLRGAELTRDEMINIYIKTLAMVVGSCNVSFSELPKVLWVIPDSYTDIENKNYGGEPFINGQAVPYDPKYHRSYYERNNRQPCITCKRRFG